MAKTSDSWDIVATVDEAPEVLIAFVAWHLEQGAATIHLYFDRENDPAAALFSGTDRVRATLCDDAHFGGAENRNPRHQRRQVYNAGHAYELSEADWLLHCDADEFLWPDRPLGDVLAGIAEYDALRIDNLERYTQAGVAPGTIFDGPFRAPFEGSNRLGARHFGPDYALTARGLTGYANGKSATRTGQGARINIHKPQGRIEGRWRDLPLARTEAVRLLHFDGLTPLGWTYKLLRKAHAVGYADGAVPSRHRSAQVQEVLNEIEIAGAARDIHDRLKVLTEEKQATLTGLGLSHDLPFDPAPAVAKWFPDLQTDLGPERHDAWLRAEKSDLIERYGL